MNKGTLIKALAGTEPKPTIPVENQTVQDIIRRMMIKHIKCTGDYDKIYQYFDEGDIWDTCYGLWEFCRKEFKYVIEDEDRQNVSSPITMLKGMAVDCKNYSLFIGGVLDAMKRHGKKLSWEYRYASYKLLQDPGHVFVVVNPNTDNIWVDPVLDEFNEKYFYWHKVDKKPKAKSLGAIGGFRVGLAQAVQNLLNQLRDYTEGLTEGVTLSKSTNTINSITAGIIGTASLAVPGATAVLAVIKAGGILLNNAFGVGSTAARIVNDLSSLNLVGIFNDIFNGRTYQSDQYRAGVYYKFYVMGQNVTSESKVADSEVWPALKWFIDRTGVFISGAQHIDALIQGPQAYLNLAKVNTYTTTDPVRVAAASQVAQRYWKNAGNFDGSMVGSWGNTIGVFDQSLVSIAQASGHSVEQVAAQTGDQYAYDYLNESTSSTQIIPGIDNGLLITAAGALLVGIAIFSDGSKRKHRAA